MIPPDSPLELEKLRQAELIGLRRQLIDVTSLDRAMTSLRDLLVRARPDRPVAAG